ncbi:MAG: hypothetical protein SAK29_24930 [Scytonema sp. PMC 1069.18]|nr:hypothetical protein [Scytonema sp. PMC 1069.18]MEC4887363.1 hypothetical protein [Scytonema sp. PMC 1070.18]
MNLTIQRINNVSRAFLSSAALISILGGMMLSASNPAQAQVRGQRIADPSKPDVTHMSDERILSAERSLDRNNCALFRYGIQCAYGNAGKRHDILKSVRQGHAAAFRGDGKVLKSFIKKVGINEVVVELQRWDISY